MATENSHHDAPVPFKIVLETNNGNYVAPALLLQDDNFMAPLPLRVLDQLRIRQYQGFWMTEHYMLGALAMQKHFKSRANDLFIASYPKSGATWLKALVFATMSRTSCPLEKNPILMYNPHQCIAYMDEHFALGKSSILEAIPSPRILNTHIPYSFLPDSITASDCRIVYIWRDPKDVIVSLWHFIQRLKKKNPNLSTFTEYFDSYCDGASIFGPIWNHIVGYWQESKRKPEKILFLKYEDVLTEPVKHARILAKFIGRPFSEVEEKQGVIEKIVNLCSFEKLKDLEVNKEGSGLLHYKNVPNSIYFRKGTVGDWKNHMTKEMAERLDNIVAAKFKEYGFYVPEMENKAKSDNLD